jgi:hypothetical protein
MIHKSLLFAITLTFSACSIFNNGQQKTPKTIYSYSKEITEEGLYQDLAVLAHDSLQGRETGTIGEEKAARFLSKRYQEMGLTAIGNEGSYYQNYELIQPAVDQISYLLKSTKTDSTFDLSVHSPTEEGNFVTIFGGSDSLSGPVAFAGAGIVNDENNINQYPVDLTGKWLFILYDEEHTNMQYLQTALAPGQAIGAIIAIGTDTAGYNEESKARQQTFGQGRGLALKYLQEDSNNKSPAFNQVHPLLAAEMLGLESLQQLSELHQNIIEEPAAFSSRVLDMHFYHHPILNDNTVYTQNVLALLEGSDPEMKDEVVVLTSHYDHVGIGQPDSTGDKLYNGADDDGSGTAATLQVAEAMAKAKEAGAGPKRSVLFLNVSGEEKGLLGSRFYSDHPVVSIENTVANINLDMIGRVDEEHIADSNYVYVIGGKIISSQLDSLIQLANSTGPELNLSDRYNDLNDPNQFYRRSDHWNFGRLGVPFVFFFNGTHEDYHRPQDHIEKITFGPLLKRTQLVYNLTTLLANSEERPEVDNQAFIEKTQVQPR